MSTSVVGAAMSRHALLPVLLAIPVSSPPSAAAANLFSLVDTGELHRSTEGSVYRSTASFTTLPDGTVLALTERRGPFVAARGEKWLGSGLQEIGWAPRG